MTIALCASEETFLTESNKIEGIIRPATDKERFAFDMFMKVEKIRIEDLKGLVKAFQPDAGLRDRQGLDVRVGHYYPPKGGDHIFYRLQNLLDAINDKQIDAYKAHKEYETIHPFTDGNGRSGRMLWWKMMGGSPIGFLHEWYYQSLDQGR